MIAFVRGIFAYMSPAVVVVDVHGVGYEIQVSLNTYSRIQSLAEGMLYTHLHIREDAQVLYGFFEMKEKELFLQLVGVNGIGAGTARIMLSSMKPEEIMRAIVQGNVKLLETIKGIGKKTAERIVLELKDKLGKSAPLSNISALENNTLEHEALDALMALGIGRAVADQALKKVLLSAPGETGLEDIIKQALKTL